MNLLRPLRLAALALLPLCATLAQADSYQVDVLVFVNGNGDGELPRPLTVPDLARAVLPDDSAALNSLGLRVLPEGTGSLEALWQRIVSGKRYTPLTRVSWVQSNPPESRGPAIRLVAGSTIDTPSGPVRALDGTVALHAGHYLHLDTDLVLTQRGADGAPVSWRLDENRKLRRDELHYLDSARLGLIVKVGKAG